MQLKSALKKSKGDNCTMFPDIVLQMFRPKVLLAFLLIAMLALLGRPLAMAIATTVDPNPPKLADPGETVRRGCEIAAPLSDFTFTPRYEGEQLVSVLVNKNGVNPNLAWAEINLEPSYAEFGGESEMVWHGAVENLAKIKGLGPQMLRAGDVWLTKQLGKAPIREIWDTASKPDAFAGYLQCVKVLLEVSKGSSLAWRVIPFAP